MALLQIEGFDWLTTASLTSAYGKFGWSATNTATSTIVSARTGTGLRVACTSGTTQDTRQMVGPAYTLSDTARTYTFGGAFRIIQTNATVAGGLVTIMGGSISNGSHIYVTMSPAGAMTVSYGAASLTGYSPTTTNPVTFSTNVWYYFEMRFKVADVGGFFTININGVEHLTFSGDTNRVSGFSGVSFGGVIQNWTVEWDDVYLLDDTGDANNTFLNDSLVQTLWPNENGASSQFTGSDGNSDDNYLLVDDPAPPDDDTTYVEATTSGYKDLYNYQNTSSLGTIHGIGVSTVGKKVEGGAADLYAIARSGATESNSSGLGLSTTYACKQKIYETDPNTTAAWSTGGVDAAQFGFGRQ